MPHQPANRVLETTTTTGNGTYTLAGASTGYQSFASGIGDGNTVDYCCTDDSDWEVGRGTLDTGAGTLTRDTIIASSNSGSAVDWSSGSKNIFGVLPAELVRHLDYDAAADTVELDTGGANVDINTGSLIVNNGSDVTLSAAELAYLDGQDQAIGSDDSPTFAGLTVNGSSTLGDGGTTNYSQFEADGTLEFNGNATVWDDLRVPVLSTTAGGSNPPTFSKFKDDGGTGSGNALEFDGTNSEYVQIPSDASLNFDSTGGATAFSIGFLINPGATPDKGNIITKAGEDWEIKLEIDGTLEIKTDSGIDIETNNPLDLNTVNSVVVTFNCTTTEVTAEAFINGISQGSDTDDNPLTDTTDVIYINSEDGSKKFSSFTMDELRIWNSILSQAQIDSFHNSGSFTETSIATEVVGYHMNEGTGTDVDNFEGTAALDIDMTASGNDPAWITGFISGASKGVFTYLFEASSEQDLHFTAQFPHSRKDGTDIDPHIHWSPTNTDTGTARWGLEYTWVDIDGTFGDTTTIYTEDAGDGTTGKHQYADFPDIDGSGITGVSSMLVCRVFRDSTHANDTYNSNAAMLEIDFHYEINTVGSRTELSK